MIVFALTAVVVFTLIITAGALVINALFYPERDTDQLAMRVGAIVSSLVAAIVGYMAGRGVSTEMDKGE